MVQFDNSEIQNRFVLNDCLDSGAVADKCSDDCGADFYFD